MESQDTKTVKMLIPWTWVMQLEVLLVDNRITLISCPTMKELIFIIDTEKDTIGMEGTKNAMKLASTKLGLYKLPTCSMVR